MKRKILLIVIILFLLIITIAPENQFVFEKMSIPTESVSYKTYLPYIEVHSMGQNDEYESFSVKEFGAVGDGVTDDTVGIQNAISKSGDKGVVYFPAGEYVISQTLVLPTKLPHNTASDCYKYHMYAPGIGMVRIVWKGSQNQTMLDMSNACSGTVIEGLLFTSQVAGITGIYAGNEYEWGGHVIRNSRFIFLETCIDGGSLIGNNKFAYFDSTIENSVFYGCGVAYDSFGSAVRIQGGSFLSNKVAININEIEENPYNKSGIYAFGTVFAGNDRDIYVNSSVSRIHTYNSCWFETSKYGIVTVSEGVRRLGQGIYFYGSQLDSANRNVMDFTNLNGGSIVIHGSTIYGQNKNIVVPTGSNIHYWQYGVTNLVNEYTITALPDIKK